MGYLSVWKILESMTIELRRAGVDIPPEVMNDLRYARTLINILKADPSSFETKNRVDEYLHNVELYLISEALEKFGEEKVNVWLRRLEEAEREEDDYDEYRFVPGIPRDKCWVRVKISEKTPLDSIKKAAEEAKLSFEMHKNGFVLIYGEENQLKDFIKKITSMSRT